MNEQQETKNAQTTFTNNKNPPIKKSSIPKVKNLGQFILGEKLGEGTFGVVRLATHILTGEKVAVKILDKRKILEDADKTRIEREIKILKLMRHNNIIHLYYVIQNSTTIYLIMEYASGKELFDYITKKKRLQEVEACKFYQQILSGIEYLHKLKVVHRDLKPENLLLDSKKDLKIVDFGLSNMYPNNELLSTSCGSPCYAAPEMIDGQKYQGVMVDIWSSGIILFAMLCGFLPFEDPDNDVLYKKITDGRFAIPSFVSDQAKDLLRKILNVDPKKRYNIHQIKNHPWFNLVNPKLNINEGLLIKVVVIPIDEDIINKMEEYAYKKEEVRANVLANKLNHITTTYYLILQEKIRKNVPSVADLRSNEFIKYIKNPHNLLKRYHYKLEEVIKARAFDKDIIEEEKKELEKSEEKKSLSADKKNLTEIREKTINIIPVQNKEKKIEEEKNNINDNAVKSPSKIVPNEASSEKEITKIKDNINESISTSANTKTPQKQSHDKNLEKKGQIKQTTIQTENFKNDSFYKNNQMRIDIQGSSTKTPKSEKKQSSETFKKNRNYNHQYSISGLPNEEAKHTSKIYSFTQELNNISINKFGSNGTKGAKLKNNTLTNKRHSNIEYKNVKCVEIKLDTDRNNKKTNAAQAKNINQKMKKINSDKKLQPLRNNNNYKDKYTKNLIKLTEVTKTEANEKKHGKINKIPSPSTKTRHTYSMSINNKRTTRSSLSKNKPVNPFSLNNKGVKQTFTKVDNRGNGSRSPNKELFNSIKNKINHRRNHSNSKYLVNASTSFEITQEEIKSFNIDSNNPNNLHSVSVKEKDKKYLQMKAKNKKFDVIKEEEEIKDKINNIKINSQKKNPTQTTYHNYICQSHRTNKNKDSFNILSKYSFDNIKTKKENPNYTSSNYVTNFTYENIKSSPIKIIPFDLSCLIFKELKDIKDKINLTLTNQKIKYLFQKNKYKCRKKDMKFNIEICKIEDCEVPVFFLKSKFEEGNKWQFKELVQLILQKIIIVP